jgi:hypothetical protein
MPEVPTISLQSSAIGMVKKTFDPSECTTNRWIGYSAASPAKHERALPQFVFVFIS